ncbi:MAG: hypothetical protein KJP04_03700, partial [Arenicella sp.]|nr:hypothetical protein [Arenicella sp.]
VEIQHLDLGGGLGIDYQGESPPSAGIYVNSMLDCLSKRNIELPVGIEPGRYIAGNSGVLLTRVEYTKNNDNKNFAIVDAGMNDLLRPSLYQAYHQIINTRESGGNGIRYDVVGPVCESADVLGYDRIIDLQADDLLAVMSAGAYGYVMASNYNSRTRPPEVMVDGSQVHVIRERERLQDLLRGEKLLK